MRGWTMGVAVSIGVLAGPTAMAEPHEALSMRVIVSNEAAVPQQILQRAQIEATRIFERADMTLIWNDDSIANSTTLGCLAVPYGMKIVSRSTLRPADDAMGLAMKGGRLAYVLYPRVADFAERHQIELAIVLGHVLAHELGHLLLPHRPHSSNGIMRGNWDRAHVLAIMRSRGGLTFTTEDAESIRRGIETTPTDNLTR